MKHTPRSKKIVEHHDNVTLTDEIKAIGKLMGETMVENDSAAIHLTAQIEGTPYAIFGFMAFVETPERLIALQQAIDIVTTSWQMETTEVVQ